MPGNDKCKFMGSYHQNTGTLHKEQGEERCPALQEWHSGEVSEPLEKAQLLQEVDMRG